MAHSPRWRPWMSRLAVESVVVVISILLALVANEWRQERDREERAGEARQAIRAELLHNYREIRAVHPYHDRLADTLMSLAGAGVGSVDPVVRPRGWMRTVDLVSAAWDVAGSTGAVSEFDYPLLLSLSRAYQEQATFRRRTDQLVELVFRMASEPVADRSGVPSPLRHPGGMAVVLNSLSDWEGVLLAEYRGALRSLGVPADSLEAVP